MFLKQSEIVLFRPKSKKKKKLNFHLSGQKINSTMHIRYLGIIVLEHFSWNQHLKMLKKKLRAKWTFSKSTVLSLAKPPKNTHYTLEFPNHTSDMAAKYGANKKVS